MTHNDIMPTDLHAKTFLVCNSKGEYGNFLFVGSANATYAAFHKIQNSSSDCNTSMASI